MSQPGLLAWEKILLGIAPILAGIFAVIFNKQINESIIKFYNIKDIRPKPLAEKRFVFAGVAFVIIGLGKIVTN